jgi:hypothetical protein
MPNWRDRGDPPDHLRRPKAWGKIGDEDASAAPVLKFGLENCGVAGISRLGIDEVGDNDIAEPLLLLAGEQPTENWVRVEARKAPPDDAPRAIDQHRDPGGQSARRLCHGVRLPTVARGERTRPRPEEVRFARDSPVEGDEFEPSVSSIGRTAALHSSQETRCWRETDSNPRSPLVSCLASPPREERRGRCGCGRR